MANLGLSPMRSPASITDALDRSEREPAVGARGSEEEVSRPQLPSTMAAAPERTNCPLCGCPGRTLFSTPDRNFGMGSQSFVYRRCRSCNAIFLGTVPAHLGDHYPAAYYPLGATTETLEERFEPERCKIELVRRFIRQGRLLEVGTGAAGFLALARTAGFDAEAMDGGA